MCDTARMELPFDAETLRYAALGAAGGTAFQLLQFAWRDRARLWQTWQHRDEPGWEFPEDAETYTAFPLSDEDRAELPSRTAWMALFGAASLAAFQQRSELIMLALFVTLALVALIRAIFADGAALVEVGADEAQAAGLTWRERLGRVGSELGGLAFLLGTALMLPELEPVRERLLVDTDEVAFVIGGIATALGVYAWFTRPPDDESDDPPTFARDDIINTLAGLAGALFIVAVVLFLFW